MPTCARRLENGDDHFLDMGHGPVVGADGKFNLAQPDTLAQGAGNPLLTHSHLGRAAQKFTSHIAQELISFPYQNQDYHDEKKIKDRLEPTRELKRGRCLHFEKVYTFVNMMLLFFSQIRT